MTAIQILSLRDFVDTYYFLTYIFFHLHSVFIKYNANRN